MCSTCLSSSALRPAFWALLLLALPLTAQQPPAGVLPRTVPTPTLKPDPAALEFGDVYEGESLTKLIAFTNEGDADWAVRQVSTSCGCTLARMFAPDGSALPTRPHTDGTAVTVLQPGQTLKVEVEFITTNQRGSVEKSVRVIPVDPATLAVTVPVRARVTRALSVSPGIVSLGSVTRNQDFEQILVMESQDIGAWKVAGFESAIEAMPLPGFLRFEVLDEQGNQRRIRLTLDQPRPVGPVSARVRILVEHERIAFLDFYVTGHVEPDVLFTSGHPTFPRSLSFDQVAPGEQATRTLSITNTDPTRPYRLVSADLHAPHSEFYQVEIRTIEEGLRYEVDLTVDGSIQATFFRGNLVLRAEHEDVPTKTVPFHGWIKAKQG